MTKHTATAASQPMMWSYAEGAWNRIPDPLGEWDDYSKALASEGFHHAESWGFPFPEIEVFEHDSDECWRIDACFDGHVIRSIEVTRLPDLIDLLAKLGTIASARVLDGLGELFHETTGQATEGSQK